MKTICILGCGWLGLPLAKSLTKDPDNSIKGSVTTAEKSLKLASLGVVPFSIVLKAGTIIGDIHEFLNNCSVLVIAVPPRVRNKESESFLEKIKTLIPYLEKAGLQKVIFISSTSVYGKSSKEGIVTEDSIPNPETDSGSQLVEVEELLRINPFFKTVILRMGGLIGEDRNPVTQLVLKMNTDANAPVNLLHQKDAIRIIRSFIYYNYPIGVYNVVAPWHPSRVEYYVKKAKQMGLVEPQFTDVKTMAYKIISSEKLAATTGYEFAEDLYF